MTNYSHILIKSLNKNKQIRSESYQIIKNKKNNELLELDKKIYGPIIIQNKS